MTLVSLLFHDVYLRNPGESGFSTPGAARYKLSLEEFDRQLSGLRELGLEPCRLIGSAPLEPVAPSALAVTVDDGGSSYYTVIADRLEDLGWRGHCFVSTDYIGRRGFLSASQLRELDGRGHVIGTHSASHPTRFSRISPDQMRREWSESREILEDLLGHDVHVGSVPGGYFSNVVAATAGDAGLKVLMTSEPVTWTRSVNRCAVAGRFTIRQGAPADLARRFVLASPWTRRAAWARWNAKGIVKPLLGSSYPRIADWIQSLIPNH
ncbi:MAG TPA: polysaccharide deacetylase family protein [Vicinamibacterales bacterium]|jgi:peptidoglycan/xylan/chitin deacetylase (PgdA/CDA1 family)|nr:polysaccharide deacetylase family protein [Vicinamibacterales bacterium]